MRTLLIAISFLLASTSAVSAQTLDWEVANEGVSAGGSIDIDVFDAPTLPVTIEVFVDNVLVGKRSLDEVPGSVSVGIPAGSSGDSWRVRVTSGTEVETQTGTVQ